MEIRIRKIGRLASEDRRPGVNGTGGRPGRNRWAIRLRGGVLRSGDFFSSFSLSALKRPSAIGPSQTLGVRFPAERLPGQDPQTDLTHRHAGPVKPMAPGWGSRMVKHRCQMLASSHKFFGSCSSKAQRAGRAAHGGPDRPGSQKNNIGFRPVRMKKAEGIALEVAASRSVQRLLRESSMMAHPIPMFHRPLEDPLGG